MNDEQRAALVRILTDVSVRYERSRFRQQFEEAIDTAIGEIDKLLADRAVPEPDADAVERAAKAMYFTDANPDPVKYDRVSAWREEWEKHLAFYQSEGYDPEGFFPAFMLAKKALAAVPEPDADAVERAAKAMYGQMPQMFYADDLNSFDPWDHAPMYVKFNARQMARAALQAAAVEPDADAIERAARAMFDADTHVDPDGNLPQCDDASSALRELYLRLAGAALESFTAVPTEQPAAGDDLDAMLDSVHPEAAASLQFIQPYLTTDPEPYWQAHVSVPTGGLTGFQKHRGTGSTRIAAIANAVKSAKETTNDHE